ncbi:hypothetical protein DCS_04041 [Drechmeria coniospora]|uniref:Uncharacterized protein n=1 Tax=Drechmeria coniospora TaxID=98403 RepID=A0A151GIW5_DRECN|nr:hypothetical protein DCS_04041 [Drechmeria coniospora]KYK57034.1 hypothetical protein DCS_04041 [Drechmeria coniospora]ODA79927.1 hypothetical protein RJ55_05524 [Drechmeria coniospora]
MATTQTYQPHMTVGGERVPFISSARPYPSPPALTVARGASFAILDPFSTAAAGRHDMASRVPTKPTSLRLESCPSSPSSAPSSLASACGEQCGKDDLVPPNGIIHHRCQFQTNGVHDESNDGGTGE